MHFIKIENRIINPEHIVMAEFGEVMPDMGAPYSRLRITLTGTQPGDYGQYPASITFYRDEADTLFERLLDYLSPVELSFAKPAPIDPTDISDIPF